MTKDETEIRALVDGWVKAAKAGDIDAIMAFYSPDIVAFDAIAALQFKGAGAYRKHWEVCLGMMTGDMVFEARELDIVHDGDLAIARHVANCGGPDADGNVQTGLMRGTQVFRRSGGRWRIAHEHFSAPFDPETGKALLGLKA